MAFQMNTPSGRTNERRLVVFGARTVPMPSALSSRLHQFLMAACLLWSTSAINAQQVPTITTFAGSAYSGFSGDGGPATSARLSYTTRIAQGPDGAIYFADSGNNRIRRIGVDGTITTIAGHGVEGSRGDGGPALQAQLSRPGGVAVDRQGIVYVSDTGNNRIRRIRRDGGIEAYAGPTGSAEDGVRAIVALARPEGMSFDAEDNLYFADRASHQIRIITSQGIIRTVAGSNKPGFQQGSQGDRGIGSLCLLIHPRDVYVARDGSLYIADAGNQRIRMIGTGGIITTVAGSGIAGFSGDGSDSTKATMSHPSGVCVGSDSNLYLIDSNNHRVRRVKDGIISTIAGERARY